MSGQKRGPKRKPVEASRTTVKAVSEGTWKRPAHLKGEAAKGWDHIVSLLRSGGNLGRTDPTIVECYAVNFALIRKAQSLILAADGEITTTNSAGCIVGHPALGVINSATMRLKAIINDLGLCPSSSKHSASAVPINSANATQTEDKWNGLLGITG